MSRDARYIKPNGCQTIGVSRNVLLGITSAILTRLFYHSHVFPNLLESSASYLFLADESNVEMLAASAA